MLLFFQDCQRTKQRVLYHHPVAGTCKTARIRKPCHSSCCRQAGRTSCASGSNALSREEVHTLRTAPLFAVLLVCLPCPSPSSAATLPSLTRILVCQQQVSQTLCTRARLRDNCVLFRKDRSSALLLTQTRFHRPHVTPCLPNPFTSKFGPRLVSSLPPFLTCSSAHPLYMYLNLIDAPSARAFDSLIHKSTAQSAQSVSRPHT